MKVKIVKDKTDDFITFTVMDDKGDEFELLVI